MLKPEKTQKISEFDFLAIRANMKKKLKKIDVLLFFRFTAQLENKKKLE